MSIDMSQFHQVFFEESFEGLAVMEAGLLELDTGKPDMEAINTIFRAAHSIKGGSGTFGFTGISDFTHIMETLLDEYRSNNRTIDTNAISLLLDSLDCLKDMLKATQAKEPVDQENIHLLQTKLETLLESEARDVQEMADPTEVAKVSDIESNHGTHWLIKFSPYEDLMKCGNDPLRMFRELDSLGDLSIKADTGQIPGFDHYEPETSYLSWTLELKGTEDKDSIAEVFEWVDGDCELDISPLHQTRHSQTAKSEAPDIPTVSADEAAEDKGARCGIDRRSEGDRRKEQVAFSGEDKRVTDERRTNNDRRAPKENSSIRVSTDKVDALINMVGQLVITQSMLRQYGENFHIRNIEKLRDGLSLLARNTRELQENVMQIRMLPISFSFNRFPRLVHDLSSKLGKKVELKMSGEQTELDKTVMEKIGDPLVHLVRNSLDHGLEMPEVRTAAGKNETGILHLNAYHEGGNIVIEINDDGAGLNKERILAKARENGLVAMDEDVPEDKINELIFLPGFSTAEKVTDVSGRGVGMDVVIRNIRALGGVVEVTSREGFGSTFTIRLPLTLAILDGQLVNVGDNIYVVPLISIVESLQIDKTKLTSVVGKADVYHLRDEYIPVLRLHEVFNITAHKQELDRGLLVVVEIDGNKIGIFVDDLLTQQQIVIKSLESNYKKVDGVSGATILGDGTVALILDINGLINLTKENQPRLRLVKSNSISSEAA